MIMIGNSVWIMQKNTILFSLFLAYIKTDCVILWYKERRKLWHEDDYQDG